MESISNKPANLFSFGNLLAAAEPNQTHFFHEDHFGEIVYDLCSDARGVKTGSTEGFLMTSAFGAKAVKPFTSAFVRGATMPANTVLAKHLFEGATLTLAWQQTLKNPWAGANKAILQVFAESGIIFVARDLFKEQLLNGDLVANEHQADAIGGLGAAILGTVATQPLVRASFKEQLTAGSSAQSGAEKAKARFSLANLKGNFRGATPAALKNVCTWSVGLTIGGMISDEAEKVFGESNTAKLSSKVAGWLIGAGIGSPFFNLQRHLQKDESAKGMLDVLKRQGVIYDPANYAKENFMPSTKIRFILGMPLDQKVISPEETKRLKVYNFSKEFPRFSLRGFVKGSPLICIAGLAIGTAELVAKRVFSQDNEQLSGKQ